MVILDTRGRGEVKRVIQILRTKDSRLDGLETIKRRAS